MTNLLESTDLPDSGARAQLTGSVSQLALADLDLSGYYSDICTHHQQKWLINIHYSPDSQASVVQCHLSQKNLNRNKHEGIYSPINLWQEVSKVRIYRLVFSIMDYQVKKSRQFMAVIWCILFHPVTLKKLPPVYAASPVEKSAAKSRLLLL